ncbi:semaphorin-7A [Carassius gibelio]|uniref:semaphorin-7A n=1 Tax=Carassius gibelio TaxID=101364 RepID=UPI002278703D|nr:semaphorin-7A [Carassius gibelio]
MDWTSLYALFICVSYVSSTKLHEAARVKVTHAGITRFSFENSNNNLVKLVSTSGNNIIWVGGSTVLYSIRPTQSSKPHQVNLSLCEDKGKDSHNSPRLHRISLLREGVDGNLFICGLCDENTKCCDLGSDYSSINCFTSEHYEPDINEPSLLVNNMLYFIKPEKGLYRINKNDKNDNIWPQPSQTEQTYLKLIAGKGEDKVYSFFAEKYKSKDGEKWIARVSQSCMNDKGGNKNLLQSSWTSTIYNRLFCGKEYEFTQMIDVATIETNNDIKIYALFKNYWNMSAVCVYSLTEISRIFNSSEFNATNVPSTHRPGTCVADSTRLSTEVLGLMKDRPEMKDWVKPENGPLLFRHHHYTHIQVDRVRDHTVLLLSLESGGVHKVREDPVFVIAEYLPFPRRTHITSMLLDASEKRLYVSSSNEVVQIDLQRCDDYGDDCNQCTLSRDPHCFWNGLQCTSTATSQVQDIISCEKPQASPSKTENRLKTPELLHVPPSSKHFLLCPVTSLHATYHWIHDETPEDCVQSELGCFYLIYSMNTSYEGDYRCVSSEEGYIRTVREYQLSMSRSEAIRLSPALLLLLTASHVTLLLILTF